MSNPESVLGLAPILSDSLHQWIAIAVAYVFLLATSGLVVRLTVGPTGRLESEESDAAATRRKETGRIIGKAENILTLTFVLLGQETGLALIIAAKSIVRSDAAKRDAQYYLGGTLVNLVWGLMVGLVTRALIAGL